MPRKNDVPVVILASAVLLAIIFLSYSKYLMKSELQAVLMNQTSSCYTGETPVSKAMWDNGNIAMATSFETPDPCYRVSSITAGQQGDRIEAKIRTTTQGICVQCFGFMQVRYEILSPQMERKIDIYVDVNGETRQYAHLTLPG